MGQKSYRPGKKHHGKKGTDPYKVASDMLNGAWKTGKTPSHNAKKTLSSAFGELNSDQKTRLQQLYPDALRKAGLGS